MSEDRNAMRTGNRKALYLIFTLVAVAGIILAIVVPSPQHRVDRNPNAPLATAMLVGALLVNYFWRRRKRLPHEPIPENPISDRCTTP